ncbi:rhamnan synthesis F family protein [Phyllobacterium zundukense]|uniref:Lipopolysaccharide biosynthesis protein n=1 Tax=Phyllobacterium zundukense TaxID=1867719 RepID=A0A2N9VVD7_9HYPH|nr:rhamnan synthesis F family protein [Phyllobacterium zundukense]ATU93997.1 hypothetical protein BLM14_19505 [Phyllobacterium zundukense]PIO43455.1 hypothetical protein B5P45_18335 [Phyllobacterium zundukense]
MIYKVMNKVAILPLRRFVRFLYHDLRVFKTWSERRLLSKHSIIEYHVGEKTNAAGDVYAVYLIWQPKQLPWYVKNALSAFNELGINVIAVVNHTLNDERLAELKKHCAHLLIRDNAGFDIGGYRDATLFIKDTLRPSRVCYLNDSIYCFREGLTELFKKLANSTADIAAPFENHEYTYHIQSFCFSVSNRIFRSEEFQTFWQNYLPVNSRLWAIDNGEKGLSSAIVPIAESVDVVYTPDHLRPYLLGLSLDELQRLNRYLPRLVRRKDGEFEKLSKPELVDELCKLVAIRSQIHTGAFLYQRFMGCPLMKRDLYYRLQFGLNEIEQNLNDARADDHFNDILADMQRKGTGRDLSYWNMVKFAEGLL